MYARTQRYQMFFYALIPCITGFMLITYKYGLTPKWSYQVTLAMTVLIFVMAWVALAWMLYQRFKRLKTREEKQKFVLVTLLTVIAVVAAVSVGRWVLHDYFGWGGPDYYFVIHQILNP